MATTAITADMVKKLRDQTGAGMMECKNALSEANGDFDEANTILRKRGLASAAKKAGRVASEGLIASSVAADGASGILAEVNCESDFVARTPDFQQLMKDVLGDIASAGDAATDAWLKDPNGPIAKRLTPLIAKLGENMAVSRFVRYAGKGYVGQYMHPGNKIGVMVEFSGVTPEVARRDEFQTLVREIAMQIAAGSPAYATREAPGTIIVDTTHTHLYFVLGNGKALRYGIGVGREGFTWSGVKTADVLEKEKANYRAQMENSGKPANVLEKIIEGKLGAFFKQMPGGVLPDQESIRDPKMSVKQVIDAASKTRGSPVTVTRFARLKVGEASA